MFNTDVSNGLIKNINGFVLKECKGWTGTVALARVEALFGGSLNDLVLSAPPQLANPQSDDDALYDGGPSPIVRRYRQQQLQLAPVAPVESPVTSIQSDHPMLVCSAGYSLIEDFSYIPECPDCGKLVHCGHRGFCPELCGCDDYLARYPPDY